jgi:hypothetical protein
VGDKLNFGFRVVISPELFSYLAQHLPHLVYKNYKEPVPRVEFGAPWKVNKGGDAQYANLFHIR